MRLVRQFAHLLGGRRLERPVANPLASEAMLPWGASRAAWLVQLRWVAVMGQLITVLVVRLVLQVRVPMGPLLTVIGLTSVSNLLLAVWSASRPSRLPREFDLPGRENPLREDPTTVPVLGLVMLLDLLLLTALLYYTGGPGNPFFIFYFVNLCVNAVVLPRGWAWAGHAVATVSFLTLFVAHRPLGISLPGDETFRDGADFNLAEFGLFVAFVTCSATVVYFTSRLRDQLRRREEQLRVAQHERGRSQKLEALGTLAAGAAHELNNPLATIAVVAHEIERSVRKDSLATGIQSRVTKDIALIKSEIDVCKQILQRMSADAGQAMGEKWVKIDATGLLEEVCEGLGQSGRLRIVVPPDAEDAELEVPLILLAQAIRGIVQNALAASANVQPVQLSANVVGGHLLLNVRDDGVGMSPAVLARVGDPFFTTKEPGHGTGLGVFLARAVIERIGGRINFESAAGRGTVVSIYLPRKNGLTEKH